MLKTTSEPTFRNLFIFSTSIEERVKQKIQYLTYQARQAYYQRNYHQVADYSEKLLNLSPRSEFAGLYFQTLSISQHGSGASLETQSRYERLAKEAPPAIQAAAILALGLKALKSNQLDEAKRLLTESYRASVVNNCAPITAIQTQSALSTLCSLQGNHQTSAQMLEQLLPDILILGKAFPAYMGVELNNYAYELSQLGEFRKASQLIDSVLSSPYASAYPEWQETAEEIQQAQAASRRHRAAPAMPEQKALNVVDIASYKRKSSVAAKELPASRVIHFPTSENCFHLKLTSKDEVFNFLCNLDIDDSQESEERLMELLYLLNFLCTDSEADYTVHSFVLPENSEVFTFQGNIHPSELSKLLTLIGNVEAYARRNPLPKPRQKSPEEGNRLKPD
jgi:hypothetical protein